MQMDTGKVQTIVGVVTQGAGNGFWGWPYNQYRVTAFWVKVSDDGSSWTNVECGKIFDGNSDTNTPLQTVFLRPVSARYVRIVPHSWYWGPGLRAAVLVCQSDCKDKKLDYQLDQSMTSTTGGPSMTPIGTGGSVTSQGYSFAKGQGVAVSPTACIENGKVYTLLVYMRLNDVADVKAVVLNENWSDGGGYVDKYWRLRPSDLVCESEVIRAGYFYWFGIRRDKEGNIDIFLNGYKCASGKPKLYGGYLLDGEIRIGKGLEDATSSAGIVDRVIVAGTAMTDSEIAKVADCSPAATVANKCDRTVTVGIPYSKFTSSSTYGNDKFGAGECGRPRINARSAWCAAQFKKNEWLQLDTGSVQNIQGIVTQGRRNADQWVTTYRVMVSDDDKEWRHVECGRIFDGNTDRETRVRNLFNQPVKARYVRILAETWNGWISMRAAVIMCEEKCSDGRLSYDMRGFRSDTGGPELTAPYGEGFFVGKEDAVGFDYPGNDISYRDIIWDDCKNECEKNSECVAYTQNVPAGRGCWLKRALGNMVQNDARTTVMMTKSRYYKERARVGYFVESGQGLQAAPEGCFKDGKQYSIILEALLINVNGKRRVLSSGGWGNAGLYVIDGRFTVYPSAAGLSCEEKIEADRVYRFGLTRNSQGKVRIYLNGMMCASATPMYGDGLRIDLTDVSIFVDREPQYQTQAYVRSLMMWDRALSQKDMGEQSRCDTPEVAGLCPQNSQYQPPASDVTYSGFASKDASQRSGRALNETSSWIAEVEEVKKSTAFMQIDLTARKQISGMNLKRDKENPWQVTAMRVMVSDDAKRWTWVECGRKFKFSYQDTSSNTVKQDFDQPVVARYRLNAFYCLLRLIFCLYTQAFDGMTLQASV
jgi:hypothetical protein